MLDTPLRPAAPAATTPNGALPPVQIEALYRALRAPLRDFLRQRLRSDEAAEDVLHDVFVKIHEHAGELRRGDRLEAWIWTIARNAVVDRSRRARPTESLESADWGESAVENGTGPDPEDNPLHCTVRLFLDSLPEPYREALVQADLEGVSQKELAARLGLSHSGLKSRVQRARRMMSDLLQQCCHLEFDRYGNIVDYSPRHGRCAGCNGSAEIEESVQRANGGSRSGGGDRSRARDCGDTDSCKC